MRSHLRREIPLFLKPLEKRFEKPFAKPFENRDPVFPLAKPFEKPFETPFENRNTQHWLTEMESEKS